MVKFKEQIVVVAAVSVAVSVVVVVLAVSVVVVVVFFFYYKIMNIRILFLKEYYIIHKCISVNCNLRSKYCNLVI